MSRKNYFTFLTVVALFLMSSLAVFAQTAPARGKVELKKADGTTVPAANVVIDVYRAEGKGGFPAGKTDKRGVFTFAGLPLAQKFIIVVSGPGIQPQVFPNFVSGREDFVYTVYEGDGRRLSEEEARQLLATPKPSSNTAATPTTAPTPSPQEAAAAKKAEEEYKKQVAEITAKNEKVKNANQIIEKALSEGNNAFQAKNYDVAIARYTEGVQADPEFAGTAPVLLNNKGIALRVRGLDTYNKSRTDTANKQSLLDSAKKDFQEAASSFQKSLAILKTATATDPKVQKDYEANRKMALSNLVETYRLLVATRADTTQNKEAAAIAEQYAAMETDTALKTKTLISLADAFRTAGDSANALPIYRKVLELAPDNVEALGGMGLSLFDVGVSNGNKEQMQEGLNRMEQFTQAAPETHPLKVDIKGAVEYLRTTEKLTPQKTARPAAKKKN